MDIWDHALGFMNAQALFAACDLGVFAALDRPEGAALTTVAEEVGLPPEPTLRLLTMLSAMGLVQRGDRAWVNAPEASAQLVPGKPGYIGAMFQHLRDDLYPVWQHVGDALREGRSQWHRLPGDTPRSDELFEEPERLRAFLRGMHAITYEAGVQLATQDEALGAIDWIVDVGGAGGSFLIALAERFPGLRGTVFDLPAVAPHAREILAEHGMSERIEVCPGSFFEDDLPEGADAYGLGFILHDWDDAGCHIILDRIARAARPGALLLVGEFLLDDDRTGPLFVARQDLNMLVAARGRERTLSGYRDLLAGHGFAIDRVRHTSGGKHFLFARRTDDSA